MAETVSPVCSRFHRAVELIGSRWTGAIIRTLLQGKTRYALIKAAIPDITDRMLSERLRSLETEGLVTRRVVPETPVRVEYELTDKGRALERAVLEIGAWAERWIPGESAESAESVSKPAARETVAPPPPRQDQRPRIRAR
jgi:DNA-binding HxlR family transcriptional regulator